MEKSTEEKQIGMWRSPTAKRGDGLTTFYLSKRRGGEWGTRSICMSPTAKISALTICSIEGGGKKEKMLGDKPPLPPCILGEKKGGNCFDLCRSRITHPDGEGGKKLGADIFSGRGGEKFVGGMLVHCAELFSCVRRGGTPNSQTPERLAQVKETCGDFRGASCREEKKKREESHTVR